MKKILTVCLVLFSSFANADLSINAFNQMNKGNEIEKQSIEMYVGGVVKGYLNANGYLGSQKQPPLFCYSGDITTGQSLKIADDKVNLYLSSHPNDGKKEMVEVILLMSLKELYPC